MHISINCSKPWPAIGQSLACISTYSTFERTFTLRSAADIANSICMQNNESKGSYQDG